MLKDIQCPFGASCTLFKCLFKHPGENVTIASNSKPEAAVVDESVEKLEPVVQDEKAAVHDQTATKKRKRPTADPTTHPREASSTQDRLKTVTGQDIAGRTDAIPRSAVKNIGTPREKASYSLLSRSSLQEEPKPTPGPSITKSAPKKPETLNPRLLLKSPAQHEIRLKLVKLLHEQYARLNTEFKKASKGDDGALVMSDQELISKTLDDEENIAVKKAAVYGNAVKNLIMIHKRMKLPQWKDERSAAMKLAKGQEVNTEKPPRTETGLTPDQETQVLHRLAMDMTGMQRFGYVTDVPKDEDIAKARAGVESAGNYEECDRCKRRFAVFPGRREEDGALTTNGPCVYHPGRFYTMDRSAGDKGQPLQKKLSCCHQNVGDTYGCTTSEHHVFKAADPSRLASVLNFAKTPDNDKVPANRAVCFDCEMGYTVYGMELIRVTAVLWPSGEELLDVLVYPVGEYLDLNTRFSGVRPEDFVQADQWKPGDDPRPTIVPSADSSKPPQRKLKLVPSPEAARDLFFSLISPNTPLIGHGLENDLNALRIIHPVLVDTILLYPHREGLPKRNGLKYLMKRELNRDIQTDKVDDKGNPLGHDSGEDALAAGELVRLKIREEWKRLQMQGWNADGEVIRPPGDDGWTLVEDSKKKKQRGDHA